MSVPTDFVQLLDYATKKYPEAENIDVGDFIDALTRATRLDYGLYETLEITLALCGLNTERHPNRQERRRMRIAPSDPVRYPHTTTDKGA